LRAESGQSKVCFPFLFVEFLCETEQVFGLRISFGFLPTPLQGPKKIHRGGASRREFLSHLMQVQQGLARICAPSLPRSNSHPIRSSDSDCRSSAHSHLSNGRSHFRDSVTDQMFLSLGE